MLMKQSARRGDKHIVLAPFAQELGRCVAKHETRVAISGVEG
jgi:hypothetical protein